VKYVFKDFPLESIHPAAFKAHEAANCAGDEGKYREMHEKIFTNSKAVSADDLTQHAEVIGLDLQKFKACLDSGKYAAEIRGDMAEGKQAGVRGTPSFFLGLTDEKDSKVKATKMLRGAQPYAQFKEAIESFLSSQ
jgi:protein-disulfide isomerase